MTLERGGVGGRSTDGRTPAICWPRRREKPCLLEAVSLDIEPAAWLVVTEAMRHGGRGPSRVVVVGLDPEPRPGRRPPGRTAFDLTEVNPLVRYRYLRSHQSLRLSGMRLAKRELPRGRRTCLEGTSESVHVVNVLRKPSGPTRSEIARPPLGTQPDEPRSLFES
jgi:hypothetical protein